MADDDHEEVNRLRGLVVKLSKEMDYKNHLLMEKESLSLEKFATMSCLMEEKDRLLGERSEVIGSLMAQKLRLHEAYIQGMQNLEDVKLELKKAKHDLEVEKSKQNQSTRDLVKYQADTNEGLGIVTTTCLRLRDKVNEQSEAMIKTMEDKQRPLKRLEKGTVLTGKRKIQCRNNPFEKSCYLCNESRYKVGELGKQPKQLQDRNDNLSITIKTESMDDDFGSSSYPVEPLRKKFKDSKSQNAKEQTSSIMEKGKATCGGRDEVPKNEV